MSDDGLVADLRAYAAKTHGAQAQASITWKAAERIKSLQAELAEVKRVGQQQLDAARNAISEEEIAEYRSIWWSQLQRERDEAQAIIEQVRALPLGHFGSAAYGYDGEAVDAILDAAPSSALDAVKADAWDAGARTYSLKVGQELLALLPQGIDAENPHRSES